MAVPSDSFTFKVVWQGGSDKNIDFTLYRKDGTVYHHGFNKKTLGSGEWQYSAWFSAPEACYVIEKPMEGYRIRYENVGVYEQVTDRCCDGGTIIIYKVPKTGDTANLALWMSMVVVGAMTLCGVAVLGKRRKEKHKKENPDKAGSSSIKKQAISEKLVYDRARIGLSPPSCCPCRANHKKTQGNRCESHGFPCAYYSAACCPIPCELFAQFLLWNETVHRIFSPVKFSPTESLSRLQDT